SHHSVSHPHPPTHSHTLPHTPTHSHTLPHSPTRPILSTFRTTSASTPLEGRAIVFGAKASSWPEAISHPVRAHFRRRKHSTITTKKTATRPVTDRRDNRNPIQTHLVR